MQRVYFISGLGADKRAFSLLDLSFCEPVFVEWIQPHSHESLENYAARLRSLMPDEHPTVVGISFGGMLATEMARLDPALKAIIVASNKSAGEFPFYLRVGKYIPLYKWIPGSLIKKNRFQWIFGARGPAQKELLKTIMADLDPAFTKWAIEAILKWKGKSVPTNVTHIHGTSDRLLLFRYVKADFSIPGGTHLLSLNMPGELSSILKKLLCGADHSM
jgi:pimeloyl-ACP methyl ester carboxylesterase